MVKVSVSPPGRGKALTEEFAGKDMSSVTVGDVKRAVQKRIPMVSYNEQSYPSPRSTCSLQYVPNRQRLLYSVPGQTKPVPLTDENKSLADYGIEDGAVIRLKDLGFQVGYRWLYIWEYVSIAVRDGKLTIGWPHLPQPASLRTLPKGLGCLRAFSHADVR